MNDDVVKPSLDSNDPQVMKPEVDGYNQYKGFDGLTVHERAVLIPQQIFDLRKDEPAFIFSRENLRTIKRYEIAVRKLPRTHDALAASADFTLLGLDMADVHVFYENLRKHVDSWGDLEDACKKMGAELQVFAEELFSEGVKFIADLKMTEAWASVEALSQVELDDAPRIPLSKPDAITFKEGVDNYLQEIASEIRKKLDSVRHVKALTDNFETVIDTHLRPMADSLLKAISKQEVSEQVKEIELELVELDALIETKLEEYNGLVGAAFYGLAFGPAGLLITGGIYGAQAEGVRAEKNDLIKQRSILAEKKIALISQSSNFETTKNTISDLQFRLVDVKAAVRNLEDVWGLLDVYVEQSLGKLDAVNTNVMLKKFVRQLERVISPWKHILGISKALSKLFNETVEAC